MRQMRCNPKRFTLMFYADASRIDTLALTALTDTDSNNRSGFAVAGHLCGNRHYIDRCQNVRQGNTRSSSVRRCHYLYTRSTLLSLFTELPRRDVLGNSYPTSCIDCRTGATIADSFAWPRSHVFGACNTPGWVCRFRYRLSKAKSGYHERITARSLTSLDYIVIHPLVGRAFVSRL
jgi:hypothetical protein